MPPEVEKCVSDLKKKWAGDPSSMPKKTKDGKPVKTDEDKTSVAWAICQAAQKAESEIAAIALEGVGPALIGIAATNRPHLPLPKLSVVEIDGKKFIRTPTLTSGIYSHPKGNLVFNKEVFDRMLQNHEKNVVHHGVSLDVRHLPKLGALAWYTKDRGGWIQQEDDPEFGTLLVGYGVPTSEEAIKTIESGQFQYASAEFAPNYEGTTIEKFSSDDLNTISLENLLQQEVDMTYPIKNEDGTVLLSAELFAEYENAQTVIKDLSSETEQFKTKIAKLESEVEELRKNDEEDELPEQVKVLLERRDKEVAALRKQMLEAGVNAALERAKGRRDEDGRAHSPVFLEWMANVMRGKQIGNSEGGIIKLEDSSDGSVIRYINEAIGWLADNLPGQVPMESRTEGDDLKLENASASKEDYKGFWAQ